MKQRRLLGALLALANEAASSDRLADVVWKGAPPEGSAAALAKEVYRLRTALRSADAAGLLVTQPPGYRLAVDAERIDAGRFASLVAQGQQILDGDPARALYVLDEALALWRGPAWAEFAQEDFARPLVTRLDELRASALEYRADALLALGRHAEVISELQQAIASYPLRERPRAQLMRALYSSGRHAEALTVYRQFRASLVDDLGLEPSPELQALEQGMLEQQADLATARPRPDPPAPGRTVGLPRVDERFVGRRTELAWLEALLARTAPGERPVVAGLAGDAGVGKTTLAAEFGRIAAAHGAAVLFLRCTPVLCVSTQLIQALGGAPSRASASAGETDAPSQQSVIDALVGFGSPRRVLLILDDMDRAPDDALGLLQRLGSAPCPVAMCAVGLVRAHPLTGVRGWPGPREHLRWLSGLPQDEAGELLGATSGARRPAELVESVWSETGGVPSLVVGIGRRLQHLDVRARAEAALTRAEGARRGLDHAEGDIAAGVLAGVELARSPTVPDGRRSAAPGAVMCPYKGLASFARTDAALFCGRERVVATLVTKLAVNRCVAVVGASGSGKSSLVAAGLIPAVAAGALPGSERWPCLLMRPGADPMSNLAVALAGLTGQSPAELRHVLESHSDAVDGRIARALQEAPCGPERLVLIVDQFEELFTACPDTGERERFIELVASDAYDGRPVSVVMVVRADFYGACADHAELARVMGRSQVLVPEMSDTDLRRIVTEPARLVGLDVEEGLAEAICRDAAAQTGALPLVSTALLETWAARSGDTLTVAGYLTAGGVRGAVARLAENVWDGFDGAERAACRRIMLRLADPEGVSSDVRRRAQRTELAGDASDEKVLAALIDRRLLTATEDTVEVAHEALFREWPRLRTWLEEDREGRRLHRQLADAAAAWQADGRDDGGCYRGVRLHAAQDWATAHPGDANALETEFLAVSEAAEDKTVRGAVRTARRLRALAAGLVILLTAALVAGVLAAVQRAAARREALQADAGRLATVASTLPGDHRDLALLLAAQAYRLRPSDETAGALQTAVVQTPPGLDRVIRYRSSTSLPHLDRTGRLLAVPGQDGSVTIYDVVHGSVLRTLVWPTPREFADFSGDDELVAAGGADGNIAIWDLATGRQSGQALRDGGGTVHAVFDPHDDTRLYVISDHGLTIWDRHDPRHPRPVHTLTGIISNSAKGNTPNLTISPDGRLVAAGNTVAGTFGASAQVWDTRSRTPVLTFVGTMGVFARDGITLPFGFGDDTLLLNAETGRAQATIPHTGGSSLATLSPDGHRIAVSEQVGTASVVTVYDMQTLQPVGAPLRLHDTAAQPVGFLPDGRLVTTGYTEAGIWTLGEKLPPIAVEVDTGQEFLGSNAGTATTVFLPGATENILTEFGPGYFGQTLQVHSAASGQLSGNLFDGLVQGDVAVSPDGRLIAAGSPNIAGSQNSGVAIWDLHARTPIAPLPGLPEGYQLSWSPTGDVLAADTGTAVQLWQVSTPQRPTLMTTIPTMPYDSPDRLLFTPDGGRLLIAWDAKRHLAMINLATGRTEWSHTTGADLRQEALAPDGRTIATDSGDPARGQLTLIDAATGSIKQSIPLQSYGGIGYLHHGQWIVATGNQSTPQAQLYDASTLQPIGTAFPTVAPYGDPVAVNSDGTLFSETEINPLIWNVDPTAWITTACSIAGRNLTHDEWRQYLPARPYQTTCPQWRPGT